MADPIDEWYAEISPDDDDDGSVQWASQPPDPTVRLDVPAGELPALAGLLRPASDSLEDFLRWGRDVGPGSNVMLSGYPRLCAFNRLVEALRGWGADLGREGDVIPTVDGAAPAPEIWECLKAVVQCAGRCERLLNAAVFSAEGALPAIPPHASETFRRLADRLDGGAMATPALADFAERLATQEPKPAAIAARLVALLINRETIPCSEAARDAWEDDATSGNTMRSMCAYLNHKAAQSGLPWRFRRDGNVIGRYRAGSE